MEKKKKIGELKERNYLREMLERKYYNEVRIPGYNHCTGSIDVRNIASKNAEVMTSFIVKFNRE